MRQPLKAYRQAQSGLGWLDPAWLYLERGHANECLAQQACFVHHGYKEAPIDKAPNAHQLAGKHNGQHARGSLGLQAWPGI